MTSIPLFYCLYCSIWSYFNFFLVFPWLSVTSKCRLWKNNKKTFRNENVRWMNQIIFLTQFLGQVLCKSYSENFHKIHNWISPIEIFLKKFSSTRVFQWILRDLFGTCPNTCSKSTIETLKKGVKYVQSWQ